MALTVRRKRGESVILFTDQGPVTVALTRIGEGSANLTFIAPKEVRIMRSEIAMAKEARDQESQEESNPNE